MIDWQAIAVVLIILAACAYVGRRGLLRLRSFRAAGASSSASDCATGCGGCGDGAEKQATKAATVIVQISSQRTTPRH